MVRTAPLHHLPIISLGLLDGPPTPRQGDIRISKQRSIQSLFEHRARVASTPEPALHLIRTSTNPRSSPTLHKVERLLTKGKDSLSMLATAAASGSLKLKSDSVDVGPKCYRTESLESFPALQGKCAVPPHRGQFHLTLNSQIPRCDRILCHDNQGCSTRQSHLVTTMPLFWIQWEFPSKTSYLLLH